MSIASKHAYRFQYLKSEDWQNVRLKALAREHGRCQLCGEESLHNDAHHMWYPRNIYQTKHFHLIILCRDCHDFLHAMRPNCKTASERAGKSDWAQFLRAVVVWRTKKAYLFHKLNGCPRFDVLLFFTEISKIKAWLSATEGAGRWVSKVAVGHRFTRVLSMIDEAKSGTGF